MKKLSFLCLFLLTALIHAAPIQNYQELISELRAGNCFRIHFDLPKCTEIPTMPSGYFIPSNVLLIPEGESVSEHIVTSFLHFTDYLGFPTYEYVTCTFYPDDTVFLRILYYDPQTFELKGNRQTIDCVLGNGVNVFISSH